MNTEIRVRRFASDNWLSRWAAAVYEDDYYVDDTTCLSSTRRGAIRGARRRYQLIQETKAYGTESVPL